MAVSRAQYRTSSRSKPSGKYIQPRVKLSMLGKAYNKVRWACYFLPVLGFIIIGYGIYLTIWEQGSNILIPQTVIAGGAILTYLAIYYKYYANVPFHQWERDHPETLKGGRPLTFSAFIQCRRYGTETGQHYQHDKCGCPIDINRRDRIECQFRIEPADHDLTAH